MKILPDVPNLEHLRREARALKARHRARDNAVCELIGHFDTSLHNLTSDAIFARKFSILDAQRVTARLYSFSSWTRLKLFVNKSTQRTDEYDPSLRSQLLQREQVRRALLKHAKKKKWKYGTKERWDEFNQGSGELLRSIYRERNWPGTNIVGRDCSEACYMLAANHTYDSDFQYLTAEMLKEAMAQGECYGVAYASIIDRCLELSYKPSIFGTSLKFNVETGRVEHSKNVVDKNNLNKRRAEVGLEDFDKANHEMIRELIRTRNLTTDRDDWESYKRNVALKGGYIAR